MTQGKPTASAPPALQPGFISRCVLRDFRLPEDPPGRNDVQRQIGIQILQIDNLQISTPETRARHSHLPVQKGARINVHTASTAISSRSEPDKIDFAGSLVSGIHPAPVLKKRYTVKYGAPASHGPARARGENSLPPGIVATSHG